MCLVVVLCTFPNAEVARDVATTLVTEKLAACVNLCTGAESIYRWEGKVQMAHEVVALIKTTAAGYACLEARLKTLHPYDTPEIIGLHTHRVLPAYETWVKESLESGTCGASMPATPSGVAAASMLAASS